MAVETRCTRCGTVNNNDVAPDDLSHGSGSEHGAEVVLCTNCSGTCNLDSCVEGDPCDRCYTETVQNRCGSSVPTAQQ